MEKLRVFEAFAGYGSQSIALRNLGINYEVVAISEIDTDAIIAYCAIRDVEVEYDIDIEKAKKELMDKNVGWDFKKKKSSIPRMNKEKLIKLYSMDKLSNNLGDISIMNVESVPKHDLFTYSFPCQDISIAGEQKGIKKGKTRSGLLYECEKIIEYHKPKYLLLENVKNLVGAKFKNQFDEWLRYLESLGYTNYWKVLNATEFNVPQNRERVFVVSILNEHDLYEFPKPTKLDKCIRDILEDNVDEKYYIDRPFKLVDRGRVKAEFTNNILVEGYLEGLSYKQISRILNKEGLCPTLDTMQGGFREPKILEQYRVRKLTPKECFRLMGMCDEDIDKIQAIGTSNSQQYKLAGNSIVIQILEGIFKSLFLKQIINNNK